MPYEFSPHERIANILYVLDQLQTRLCDSDVGDRNIWHAAIDKQLANLNQAVLEMAPEPTTETQP
jgi:hypothetical protein